MSGRSSPDVAFYLPQLSTGGVGKMRTHLAREMVARGLGVDFLLGRTDSPYRDTLGAEVGIHGLATTHALASVPGLVRYLRRRRPRVLITDRLRLNLGVLRALALARVETRSYTSVHIPQSHKLARREGRKAAREKDLLRRTFPRNDGVIAVSRGIRDDLVENLGLPPEKVHVVHNPAVTPEIRAMAGEPVDHPFLADPEVPVVLSAGRMMVQKDFPTLIRAFARLRATRPCRLVILGQGRLQGSLRSLADELGVGEDVDLPGFTPNPYAYMARARLFVLSSLWEGSPNVRTAALAVGVPVGATDCEHGPREILDDGRYGPLVPVGDAVALAAAMARTLDDPLPPETLRRAATPYTVERSCDGYLEVFRLAPPGG
jgi:glycosyltransferase involved in cell wall biosynthesis